MRTRSRTVGESEQGLTLVEILLVLALMVLAVSGASVAVGAVTRTQLRSASMKVLSASRYAYARAASQGHTVRMLLDLDKGMLAIEEAKGDVVVAREGEGERRGARTAEGAVSPWETARSRIETTLQPAKAVSLFGPIRGARGEVLDRYKPQVLARGIRISRVLVPHAPAPIEKGRAAIYFFRGGRAEHAVIQLRDSGDRVYSVELDALTGKGEVFAREVAPSVGLVEQNGDLRVEERSR